MNVANSITFGRICLIPVFIGLLVSYREEYQWIRYAAIILFVGMAVSDWVDGWVARRFNQSTKFGRILDPGADKVLVNATYIFLAVNHELESTVPRWVPVIIMLRDVCILVTSLVIDWYRGPIRPIPRVLGKVTTWAYSFGIMGYLLQVDFAHELLMAVMVIACLSWADYAFFGHERVVDDPFIKPKEKQ